MLVGPMTSGAQSLIKGDATGKTSSRSISGSWNAASGSPRVGRSARARRGEAIESQACGAGLENKYAER
jgi:hypothetical protein